MSIFRRFSNLVRGFFGLFLGGLEKQSPEALLEVERENLREQVAKYNQGLASHAALCERLMAQVKRQEAQEKELKAKITRQLREGDKDGAGQLALTYQGVGRELAENRKQLENAEQTYKNMLKARDVSIAAVKDKIASLRQGISDMKVKQASAELTEMASGMIQEMGGAGETLNRLEQMVETERQQASGRARVARDALSTTDIDMKEAEQTAMAEAALADFAAQEGITIEGAEAPPAALEDDLDSGSGKSMGPEKQAE